DLFKKAIYDSSYSVAGAALEAYADLDGKAAYTIANALAKAPAKGRLQTAISNITVKYGDESAYDFIFGNFVKMPLSQ
ncbi:hypothetical protein ACSTLJ_00325, partial [Vibrio parahaemolyticus]